jgi:microcystin degradation protein MlrC
MNRRVALAGIHHESNTFLSEKTTYQDFVNSHLLTGAEIREEYARAHHEVGGILEVFDQSEIEIVPLFFAEATPGGTLQEAAYEKLCGLMMDQLERQAPWDGIVLCAHGAAVAENYPDMDGDWLARVRALVGPGIPIVVTIDPHANVSERMTAMTDGIVAYATNPHLDQRETGRKAARMMLSHLSGEIKMSQALYQSRVSISIEQQATSAYPCRMLYDMAAHFLKEPGVISISVILGFPYADVAEMGSSFIVITDDNPRKATTIAEAMGHLLEENHKLFVGEKITVEEAIERALALEKPVLLLDMGDNVGGGSPGDGALLLHTLSRYPQLRYFACIFDPEAVEECRLAEEKAALTLTVGGKSDKLHGAPCRLEVSVVRIAKGIFRESEPRHGGQVNYDMGAIAIVETANRSTLMLISRRTPPFSLNQLTTFAIQPQQYDIIIAKGVHAPVAAYAPVCPSLIRVDTPGVTRADATKLTFKNRRKPLFPFEELKPEI